MPNIQSICVYCGSSSGANPAYLQSAREVGQLFAQQNIALVFGGGAIGMMGTIANAVLAHGGKAIGIIPERLVKVEVGHSTLTEQYVVADMHTRKALMMQKADAFMALPGGVGTFEELFEVMTWLQLGYLSKPIGVLNVNGYFDPLLALLDHSVREGFLRPAQRDLLLQDSDPQRLLDQLRNYTPQDLDQQLSLKVAEELAASQQAQR